MTYAVYARKSSEPEDRQISSIPDQLDALSSLISSRDVAITLTESRSAKKPGRPEFLKLVELLKTGHVQGIITWNVNRLSRNAYDGGVLTTLIDDGKLMEIVTPTQTFRNTPMDKFMFSFLTAQAKLENDNKSVDVKRGMDSKIKNGHAPIRAFVGYRNRSELSQGLRDIVADPVMFPLMRLVFDKALTGLCTVQELYDYAQSLHILGTNGRPINRTSFYDIIQNPVFYTGRFFYTGELRDGKHPRMITDDEYDILQKLYAKKKRYLRDSVVTYNGFIQCNCGHYLTSEKHIKHYKNGKTQIFSYMRCVHCTNTPKSIVSVKSLDEQVSSYLSTITIDEEYINLYIKYLNEQHAEENTVRDAETKAIERAYHDANHRVDALFELYLSPDNKDRSILTDTEYKQKRNELVMLRSRAKEQLDARDTKTDQWQSLAIKVFTFASTAKKRFDEGSMQEKKIILQMFGSNLTVNGKYLDITLREPFRLIQGQVLEKEWIEPTMKASQSSKPQTHPSLYPIGDAIRTYYAAHSPEATQMQHYFRVLNI